MSHPFANGNPSINRLGQTWQPLLQGEQQIEALTTVAAIAHYLRIQPTASGYQADLALFFSYLSQAQLAQPAEKSDTDQAIVFLEQAVDHLTHAPIGVGLYGGLAGVGWTLAHVGRYVWGEPDEEACATIDELLYEYVGQTPWIGEYDLINGLVGIGVYALERLPNPIGSALLARVIDRLDEVAVRTPSGIAWFTPPERLPEAQRKRCPHGYYNLGVAHGVPGVIALLGRAMVAGVATDKAKRLLDGAIHWLLAQEIPSGPGLSEGGFPVWVSTETQGGPARLAWCYGDVGIAAILLRVARSVGKPDWATAALRIARRAAQRPYTQSGVRDSCLCHGAAGLAHLFNCLYQATGDSLFGDTARFWLEQMLALRQPEQGIAGYCFLRGEQDWDPTPGFLEGAAGIGLALLAAATSVEPAWDRLLLVT